MESEGNRRETTRKILKKMLNFRFLSWYVKCVSTFTYDMEEVRER